MIVPLKIRGIDTSKYKLNEFILIALYIPSLNQEGLEFYTWIKYKLCLVYKFKANIVISKDVFYIEGFSINFTHTFAHILKYRMSIEITIRSYSQFIKRNILVNAFIFVLPKSKAIILFCRIPLPDLHDFLFYPHPQQ